MPVDTVLLLSMLVIAAVPNRLHSVVDGRGEEARASKEANRERVRVIRTRPFLPSSSPPSLPACGWHPLQYTRNKWYPQQEGE